MMHLQGVASTLSVFFGSLSSPKVFRPTVLTEPDQLSGKDGVELQPKRKENAEGKNGANGAIGRQGLSDKLC